MSLGAWIEEAKDTTWQTLPHRSFPIRMGAIIVWVIVCASLGHYWVLGPVVDERARTSERHAKTQGLLDDTRERLNELGLESTTQLKAIEAHATLKQHWGGVQNKQSLDELLQSLARSLDLNLDVEAIDQGKPIPISVGEHISLPLLRTMDHRSYRVQASGSLRSLLAWLHALMDDHRRGRFFLHEWQIDKGIDKDVRTSQARGAYRLDALVTWLGAVDVAMDVAVAIGHADIGGIEVVIDSGFGEGLTSPTWWQALPIERLSLVGLGHVGGFAFAWIKDPTGELRSLQLGVDLSQGRWRVAEIQPDHVRLMAQPEQVLNDQTLEALREHIWVLP
jgi:hypothetical protein